MASFRAGLCERTRGLFPESFLPVQWLPKGSRQSPGLLSRHRQPLSDIRSRHQVRVSCGLLENKVERSAPALEFFSSNRNGTFICREKNFAYACLADDGLLENDGQDMQLRDRFDDPHAIIGHRQLGDLADTLVAAQFGKVRCVSHAITF